MPAPIPQAAGTPVASTGTSVNVAWPTHLANDIGIVVIETAGNSATLTPATGWAAIPGTPVVDLSNLAGSKLHVWWRRATSSAMPVVATGATANHIIARLYTVRGCVTTGNPWNVVTTGIKTAFSTTATVPSLTPTLDETLITMIVGRPNDNASTTHFGVPVNANLTGLAEAGEAGTTSGNGGGFVVATGRKALPGATGTSTLTKTASTTDTYVVFALKEQTQLIATTRTFALAGTTTRLLETSTIIGSTGTFTIVGNDVDLSTQGTQLTLDTDVGTFSLAGTTTGLLETSIITSSVGTFTIVGTTTGLLQNSKLDNTVGTFTLAGTNTGLLETSIITSTVGTFTLAGTTTGLLKANRIDSTLGTFALAGTTTGLLKANRLDNTVGTFSLVGTTTGLIKTSRIDTTLGTFTLAGTTTGLFKAVNLDTNTGTFTVVGNNNLLQTALRLNNTVGTFILAGNNLILSPSRNLNVTTRAFNLAGVNVNLTLAYRLNGQVSPYQINTFNAELLAIVPLTLVLDGLPLELTLGLMDARNFFWYRTTQTIQPVKYKITKRNEFILGRQTHMGRRGL